MCSAAYRQNVILYTVHLKCVCVCMCVLFCVCHHHLHLNSKMLTNRLQIRCKPPPFVFWFLRHAAIPLPAVFITLARCLCARTPFFKWDERRSSAPVKVTLPFRARLAASVAPQVQHSTDHPREHTHTHTSHTNTRAAAVTSCSSFI